MRALNEMKLYASRRRPTTIQPYTFKRWLDELEKLIDDVRVEGRAGVVKITKTGGK